MTWVIGSSTMFGYGVVMSDVRVTCGDTGITMDVLQKALPMGPFMVAGLAGDVGIGLTLLRSMQLFLRRLKPEPDDCYDPDRVAENWSKEARQIYGDISHDMTAGDVHIITVGLQVKEGVLGGAIPCVTIYKSPEFSPETVVGGNQSLSIGSGARVDIYRNSLERMLKDKDLVYMKGEIGSIGGFGRLVWQMIQMDIKNNPIEKSISPQMQLFLIRLGRIEEWRSPNMPELATDWPELLNKIDKRMNTQALTT